MKQIKAAVQIKQNTNIMLKVENIGFSYKNAGKITPVFSDVSFQVERGSIFILLGANGAGKSTLFNCLSNMLIPDMGEIFLKGQRFSDIGIREMAKIMGYVPQLHTQMFSYTVLDYVVMGRAPYMNILSVPKSGDYDKAGSALRRMKIEHLSDKIYTQLSGGERQQVQIARVLVQEPEVILLDEPTNHLDYGNQLKILQTIFDLAKEGITVLMTTHMPDHAILLEGTAGILDDTGHLVIGNAEDIVSAENLERIYHTSLRLVYIDEVGRKICVPESLRPGGSESSSSI